MKRIILICTLFAGIVSAQAQSADTAENRYINSAERMLATDGRLTIGGYGEVYYNQPIGGDVQKNGKLDVQRLVMLFGYKFSNRVQFITEIEYEHVKEVYIEQAFLQYKLNNFINFRGGLLLVPMGIINEYHEPVTFNGVTRPLIDKYIVPTTWREIGVGITGTILPASLNYQAYVINGFNGYDGSPNLSGKNGFRKGRQKGAESFISSPNFTAKVEYFGIRGLNVGLSGYFGNTQSTLYNGITREADNLQARADSSVVGMAMLGVDARYSTGGLQLRGQYYLASLSNTLEYNTFTATDGELNDLGSAMSGYYLEAGYNIFRHVTSTSTALIPFIRYEAYNTQQSVESGVPQNAAYDVTVITPGLTWKMTPGAVLKADLQFIKSAAADEFSKVFNAGIGVMF